MQILIREIDKESTSELRLVTERCMAAVLETIPEFEADENIARRSLPNFTVSQMEQMIAGDFADPMKRIMVATIDGVLVGQSLYSIKKDSAGLPYGFCFSRYVIPHFRKKGIATVLLNDAIGWFQANGAAYAVAQTHSTNKNIQSLFVKFGFILEGPFFDKWEYLILKKYL